MIVPQFNPLFVQRSLTVFDFSGGSLPAGATLTRSSAKENFNSSGLLVSLAVDAPAWWYDPATLAFKGLRLDPVDTGRVLQSRNIGVTWTNNHAGTISASGKTDPSGGTSAKLLPDDTTTNIHSVFQYATSISASGVVCVINAIVAANTLSWCSLRDSASSTATAFFDIANGVVGTVSGTGAPTAWVENWGNGWWRIFMRFTTASAASPRVRLCTATGDGVDSYLGTGKSIHVFGAQFQDTGGMTVPTTTTTAVRSADVLTLQIPVGWSQARVTFDDASTQDFSVTGGAPWVVDAALLNRPWVTKVAKAA